MDGVVFAISEFGFPIVIAVGLGYFVYYVWRTIINVINPAIKKMHFALIKLIDQIRMLDNDMIRLQEKVDTVLQIKEHEKINGSISTISRNDGDSG
jgi:hypothetical protein